MKARIFKTTLYTLLLLAGMQGVAVAQQQTEKEKELEAKLKALEQKMDAMQAKMDSMKTSTRRIPTAVYRSTAPGSAYSYTTPTAPTAPRTMMVPRAQSRSYAPATGYGSSNSSYGDVTFSKSFDDAFATKDKLTGNSMDKKIEEKIKSGEIKEVTKMFSKSYPADKNDQLSIDNKFGKVTVNTWNKNEFKVDVQIKADANEQDEAQKLSDGVSITDSKDGNTVSFKTTFKENNNSWSIWSSNNNDKITVHRVQIDYVVYMPAKNSLSISNRYGATTVPDFDGKLTINNSYGAFTAKNLSNPANEITTRYGAAAIENLKGSDLKVSYGSLNLGTCDNINAEISYSPVKIATIKTSGNISLKYGAGMKIGELDKNLKNLNVNSSFAPVGITVNNNLNCDFDVTVQYNDFKFDDSKVKVTTKTPTDDQRGWSNTKTYKGYIGKSNSDKKITITAKYQGVKID